MPDIQEILFKISVMALPLLFATTLREVVQGYLATWFGDPTPRLSGRLTFNPLSHVDPVGTVLVPLTMFVFTGFMLAWPKKMPVNFEYFRNPKLHTLLVLLAGPGFNLLLAYISALLLHMQPLMPDFMAQWYGANLVVSVQLNVVLALFNMMPLPPLDGGYIAMLVLPDRAAQLLGKIEPYGPLIILGLFALPALAQAAGVNFNPLMMVLWPLTEFLMQVIAGLAGLTS